MSTAVLTQPATIPGIPPWVPTSFYRLTLEQYEAMVDAGILGKRDRVHLIDGFLVSKMTENDPHATADELCAEALSQVIPAGWRVRAGKPIRIPGLTSRPEPDRSVVRGGIRNYAHRTPGPADLALVVEVSDATLADDRKLAVLYGLAGIPFYWIVNLVDGQVEVYSRPGPAGYESLEVLAPGHVLAVVIDGVEVGRIPVADILP
jgi:Uma2 family endonuclease